MPSRFMIILPILAVLLCSCLDTEIHTRINSDGSCVRYLTVKGDSSHMTESFFPIPMDSSWNP